ncbi:RHS repeat domain-containing protein [Pedobacter suwonensis]|uniref:RHS repeat domain-containing protein n=1 Tax=Pedobacter suwonensis TaxID=332999 RepID=UPI001648C3E5|nr:RHS repeat-associated core domain-containing protein [Pedobacter suwonensis]
MKTISGFTNGSYVYNENGNLISDGPSGTTIGYNYLNLPVTVSGGQNITYTYDASGKKLAKTNAGVVTANYLDGITYKANGVIDFIQTEEGIARNNNGSFSYEYNLQDHLDNVRTSFHQNPVSGILEPIQRDDYYAFGQRRVVSGGTNKYLYSGKEIQEELGQYDYGARFYNPVIGRWNITDPLADMFHATSPYTFSANNPILFIDKFGLDTAKAKNLGTVNITASSIARSYERLMMWTNGFGRIIVGKTLDHFDVGSNSSNFFMVLANSSMQRGKTNLTGGLLEKLKKDPGMVRFRRKLMEKIKNNPGLKKVPFTDLVEFGGKWEEGNKLSVTTNTLTWAIRHSWVKADAIIKPDGTIVVQFSTSDTLDLTPQETRSASYNVASFLTGTVYHGLGGGSMDMKVEANWTETIKR